MNDILVGIDIGGSFIKLGFFSEYGDIFNTWEIPTNKTNNGSYIIDDICCSLLQNMEKQNFKEKQLRGIGIGIPGFIDKDNGFVYEAANIGWKNYDIKAHLNRKLNFPVFIENDANLAALGEKWLGAGKGIKDLIVITLGTGVGGGIIANGEIIDGIDGVAGEIGHISILGNGYQCSCGRIGCLETIASATGIVRQAMEIVKQYPRSRLAHYLELNGSITAKAIFDMAKEGDSDCERIISYTTDILGMVIANLAVIFNPSRILIGGGLSKAGDYLIINVQKSFTKYALPRARQGCVLSVASLGNNAGIIGAASLVKKHV